MHIFTSLTLSDHVLWVCLFYAGRIYVNASFLQAIKIMEVPVVKIKEGVAGSEAGEKLIKSIVNMVCLGTDSDCTAC